MNNPEDDPHFLPSLSPNPSDNSSLNTSGELSLDSSGGSSLNTSTELEAAGVTYIRGPITVQGLIGYLENQENNLHVSNVYKV